VRVSKTKRVKGTGRVARMEETGNNGHKFSRIIRTGEKQFEDFNICEGLTEMNLRKIQGD
jgi:hypothetical protein